MTDPPVLVRGSYASPGVGETKAATFRQFTDTVARKALQQ